MPLEYGVAPRVSRLGLIVIGFLLLVIFGGLGMLFGAYGWPLQPAPENDAQVRTSESVTSGLHISFTDAAYVLSALYASRGARPASIDTTTQVAPPLKKDGYATVDMPTTSARAFAVRDVASGAVLMTKDAYTPYAIASITKLVSALVLLDTRLDWSATSTVPAGDFSDSQLMPGEVYTNDWLWHAALIGSSNRAIMAMVDGSGLTREAFVVRMNDKARVLGMSRAVFTDPTGLDAGNEASAVDVAILLEKAMQEPRIRDTLRIPSYTIERVGRAPAVVWNTDWLLLGWVPHSFVNILGGKTGYIPEAGNNVTVRVEGDSGHMLDVVVLGSSTTESRFTDAKHVAEWVFNGYQWPTQ